MSANLDCGHSEFEGGDGYSRPPFFALRDYLIGYDMFGVRPTMEFNGKRKYKSCWGAFVSALMFIFIIFFVIIKLSEPEKDQNFLKSMDNAFGGNLVYAKSDLPEIMFPSEELRADYE